MNMKPKISRVERFMATCAVLLMRCIEIDYSGEDSLAMPAEIADWADPALWRASCVGRADRVM